MQAAVWTPQVLSHWERVRRAARPRRFVSPEKSSPPTIRRPRRSTGMVYPLRPRSRRHVLSSKPQLPPHLPGREVQVLPSHRSDGLPAVPPHSAPLVDLASVAAPDVRG